MPTNVVGDFDSGDRRAFYSVASFMDAESKAQAAHYLPIKRIYNVKKHQYVVFARKLMGTI